MTIDIEAITNSGRAMYAFAHFLESLGFEDDEIGQFIRLGGNAIPIFGSQLKGCYWHPQGRCCHFAVPGWYEVIEVRGTVAYIRSKHENSCLFDCSLQSLKECIRVNFHYVEQGLRP